MINSNIYEIPPSMIEHKLKFKEMKRLKEKKNQNQEKY